MEKSNLEVELPSKRLVHVSSLKSRRRYNKELLFNAAELALIQTKPPESTWDLNQLPGDSHCYFICTPTELSVSNPTEQSFAVTVSHIICVAIETHSHSVGNAESS